MPSADERRAYIPSFFLPLSNGPRYTFSPHNFVLM
jgi:hypothetical protein